MLRLIFSCDTQKPTTLKMPKTKNAAVERGSPEHRDAINRVDVAVKEQGLGSVTYYEAVDDLAALQQKVDWQMTSGVLASSGVGRKLCVQFLDSRLARVPSASGEVCSWDDLKSRLVSQPVANKEDASFFLLVRFYSDGYEKLSFTKPREAWQTPSYGISRCKENIEWIDGLTLDFDSGLTVEDFQEQFSQYEYLLTSSFNHDPSQGLHKFRVLIPLKDRVGALELKRRKDALSDLFKEADVVSFALSQGFYAPSHRHGIDPVRYENSGQWFDLMALTVNEEQARNQFGVSMRVSGVGDGAELVAALMNCMPSDTEYFRELPCFKKQTYPTAIVPFLFSLGYWGRENGLDVGELRDLVFQRWGDTQYAGSFSSLLSRGSYGGLESCLGFVERVRAGVLNGVDLGFDPGEFQSAHSELLKLVAKCVKEDEPDVVEIEEATNRLQNLLLQRVREYSLRDAMRGHLVVRFEAGAGKTKQAHFILSMGLKLWGPIRDDKKPWVIDYLVPDNDLAAEVAKRLEQEVGSQFHIQHIQGRSRLCIDPKVIEAEELGHKVSSPCEGCEFFDRCPYPAQFSVPDGKHAVRVIYQGMISNKKAGLDPMESPDFYIVDEDLVTNLYAETVYGHAYDFVKTLPTDLSPSSTSKEIRDAIVVAVVSEERKLRLNKERAPSLPAVHFSKFRKGEIGVDVLRAQIAAKKKAERARPDRKSHAACRALVDDLKWSRPQAVSIREQLGGARVVVASYLRPLAARYAESPCIYLDATAERLAVERALVNSDGEGRAVDYWECNVGYSKNVTVHQDVSRSWSMASLCPRIGIERVVDEGLLRVVWDEIVRRSLIPGRKFAIISYKAVDEYISSGKVPAGCRPLKGDPSFCGAGHFGNIRGQDCFNQDGVEDLYVIGRMMVSHNVVEDHARAIYARDMDALSFEKHIVMKVVGTGVVLKVDEYRDERVQAVDNLMNAAETAQAAHRLRLIHGDTVKNLYLVTNACLPIRVNKVMEISGGRLTKVDKLTAQVRCDLIAGEFASRVGKQWKSYPKCLEAVDARMRKSVLDRAVTDLGVGLHLGFACQLKTLGRKLRQVLILGRSEEECRSEIGRQYPDDGIIAVKGAPETYKKLMIII